MKTTSLDRLDRLLGLARRCERLAALCDAGTRSPELIRAVSELRLELAAEDRFRSLDQVLLGSTAEGVRIGLASVRTTLAQAQRQLLATRGAA